MIKFDRSRIERIAKTIVADISYTGNTSTVYLHNYGGGKYCVAVFPHKRSHCAYFINNGKIEKSQYIGIPDKDDYLLTYLTMHWEELSDLINSGKNHKRSILIDLIKDMKEYCKKFDKYSDEELGERYDHYYYGKSNTFSKEDFIISKRPNSKFFVRSLLNNDSFLSKLKDDLMDYYFSNHCSFDGLYENDNGIVCITERQPE